MPRDARPGNWGFLLGWGERQTLDGLFRRHGDAVYRLAAVTLGDREEASDVTGEVFLQAARKLRELRDLEALWPWLKTVTLNLCRDRARQGRATPVCHFDGDDERLATSADGAAGPGESDLTAMVVRDCVARLAPRERQVIIPYYQHGMTYREIAAHLGLSLASVQWWMDRGLKHLAELVTAELGCDSSEQHREGGRNGVLPPK